MTHHSRLARLSRTFAAGAAVVTGLALAPLAHAAELFNNTPYTGTFQGSGFKPANSGVGQTLAFQVSAIPAAIGSFGFLLTADAGTTFKYLIFFGKSQKLFEINRTTTSALSRTLFLSPEFNFKLTQSNQYTFAVVADRAFSIDYDTQSRQLTQNGITEMIGQNANYVGFTTPLYDANGLAEIKMVLNSAVAAVPEPSSGLMMLAGLLAAVAAVRARRAA